MMLSMVSPVCASKHPSRRVRHVPRTPRGMRAPARHGPSRPVLMQTYRYKKHEEHEDAEASDDDKAHRLHAGTGDQLEEVRCPLPKPLSSNLSRLNTTWALCELMWAGVELLVVRRQGPSVMGFFSSPHTGARGRAVC
jgi:hypothetical protein